MFYWVCSVSNDSAKKKYLRREELLGGSKTWKWLVNKGIKETETEGGGCGEQIRKVELGFRW